VIAFNVDGAGAAEQVNWLNPGYAFLALDRNGDGRIGSGLEISFTQDKAGAKTDLEGLTAFDTNKDGKLSAADMRFSDFLVWQDANGNGTSEPSELRTLTQAGVSSIGLNPAPTGKTLANTSGNVILNTAGFTRTDGSSGLVGDAVLRPSATTGANPPTTQLPTEPSQQPTPAANAAAITFVTQAYERSSKKYILSAAGEGISLSRAAMKGVVNPRAGRIPAAALLNFKNKSVGMLSPVILDLDGDGIELQSMKKSKARFDMDGNGVADDTGWVGKGDGFLVIDRNGDGLIRGASELSFLGEKLGATSDLDALSALDSNRDGKIDAADTRFGELKVWVDADHDGVTDVGELKSLAEHGIASIGLTAAPTRETAKVGQNIVLSTGVFTRTDGSTGTLADAALAFKPGAGGGGGLVDAVFNRFEPNLGPRNLPLEESFGERSGSFWRSAIESFDFDEGGGDPAALPPLPQSDAQRFGEIDAGQLDPRSALMTQYLASFGGKTGVADLRARDGQSQARFDYFA
jgi:hypothetical protein